MIYFELNLCIKIPKKFPTKIFDKSVANSLHIGPNPHLIENELLTDKIKHILK